MGSTGGPYKGVKASSRKYVRLKAPAGNRSLQDLLSGRYQRMELAGL